MSTPTLDAKRVGQVLPTHGSEDASQLLRYSPPPTAPADTAAGYYAHASLDWTVPVQPAQPMGQHQLRLVLGRLTLSALGDPTVYGRSAHTGRWTYAQAGTGADSVFTALALSWKLADGDTATPHSYSAATLQGYQRAVAALAPKLAARAGTPSLPVAQAARRSAELSKFVAAANQPAIIVLQADKVFEGRAAWDALLSVGLRWGDEDCFHWDNPVPEVSGTYLFDVATSTEPGYFLPEQVAAGHLNPADLVFSFSIPRTAAPAQVLASMHRAATYCQRRLGGRLLDGRGRPFDLAAEQQKCRAVEVQLRTRQLQPGVGDALYLF